MGDTINPYDEDGENFIRYVNRNKLTLRLLSLFIILFLGFCITGALFLYYTKCLNSCENPRRPLCSSNVKCEGTGEAVTTFDMIHAPQHELHTLASSTTLYNIKNYDDTYSGPSPRTSIYNLNDNFRIGVYEYFDDSPSFTGNINFSGPSFFKIESGPSHFPIHLDPSTGFASSTNVLKDKHNNNLLSNETSGTCTIHYLFIMKNIGSSFNHNLQQINHKSYSEFIGFDDKEIHIHYQNNNGEHTVYGPSPIFSSITKISVKATSVLKDMYSQYKYIQKDIIQEGISRIRSKEGVCAPEPGIIKCDGTHTKCEADNNLEKQGNNFGIQHFYVKAEKNNETFYDEKKVGEGNFYGKQDSVILQGNERLFSDNIYPDPNKADDNKFGNLNLGVPTNSFSTDINPGTDSGSCSSFSDIKIKDGLSIHPLKSIPDNKNCIISDDPKECNPFSFRYSEKSKNDINKLVRPPWPGIKKQSIQDYFKNPVS